MILRSEKFLLKLVFHRCRYNNKTVLVGRNIILYKNNMHREKTSLGNYGKFRRSYEVNSPEGERRDSQPRARQASMGKKVGAAL